MNTKHYERQGTLIPGFWIQKYLIWFIMTLKYTLIKHSLI